MTERLDRPGVALVLKLGERNTPRSCVANDCDLDADYYILTDEVFSEYACEEHLEGTIERAQA